MWLPKENKYVLKSLYTLSEATTIEKDKAAYLEIYTNLQQGKFLHNLRYPINKTIEKNAENQPKVYGL